MKPDSTIVVDDGALYSDCRLVHERCRCMKAIRALIRRIDTPGFAISAVLVGGLGLLLVGPQGSVSTRHLWLMLILASVVCALRTPNLLSFHVGTIHWPDRVLRVTQVSVFAQVVLLLSFFVVSGRPTADEYLLGPILHGYYVDQPQTPLFEPSTSTIINYLSGAASIVRLGWDGWPNAMFFQMGPSIMLNELGPTVSIIQGLVFSAITWWCCGVTVSALSSRRSFSDLRIPLLISAIIGAMSVGNFNTPRVPFGLYPFLGIRFGLYLVHALMFVSYLTWVLVREDDKSKRTTRVAVTGLILVVGLVSLWYTVLLGFFLLGRLLWLALLRRSIKRSLLLVVVLPIATLIFHDGLKGARGRTAAEDSSIISVVNSFLENVVFNHNSRVFSSELWSTIYGLPAVVGLVAGILCYVTSPNRERWTMPHVKKVAVSGLIASPMIPVIFVFQEFISYEAWWHRTTPITLSAIIFFFAGIWIGSLASPTGKEKESLRLMMAAILSVTFLVTASGEEVRRSVSSIAQFRTNWDRGNIFGIGSPVENDADYNVLNILRISPYVPDNWDVQGRITARIPTLVTFFSPSGVPIPASDLVGSAVAEIVLETTESVFDNEIGGFLRYRLSLSLESKSSRDVIVRDSQGSRTAQTGSDGTIEINGLLNQPGRVVVSFVHSGERPIDPFRSYELKVGLSGSIRERFRLDESDLELKS